MAEIKHIDAIKLHSLHNHNPLNIIDIRESFELKKIKNKRRNTYHNEWFDSKT